VSADVRATDAELAEVLRHARALASETNLWLSLLPRVCRELATLREQHRAADETLTRCGIEATSPRDTLADRLLRLVKDSNDAATLTKAKADLLDIAERAIRQRDAAEAAREALREKARAVCDLEWEGAWRMSDEDSALFSDLRAEVDR
jgi:hypothetical protein